MRASAPYLPLTFRRTIRLHKQQVDLEAPLKFGLPSGRRWNRFLLLSFALHGLVIYLLLRGPAAVFLRPSEALEGNAGRSVQAIFVARKPPSEIIFPKNAGIYFSAPDPKQRQPTDAKSRHKPRSHAQKAEPLARAGRAGSLAGSAAEGWMHDIRPAIPVIFPDPDLSGSNLPAGIQGDVIVEVTIDSLGNVTQFRLLQSFGHDIDQKVIMAVQKWHFRPATKDGVAIASKHDVHFHLPS